MTASQNVAIADLKNQFEHVIAQWRMTDEPEPVRIRDAAAGRWLFDIQTPGFVNCQLNPPRSLWLAAWQVSTKVPELSLVGANYKGQHRLVIVAEWRRRTTRGERWIDWLSSIANEPLTMFSDPVREIALKRSVRAILRILEEADQEAVQEAAGQGTDVGVVAKALQQPQAIELLPREDPFAEARLRGVAAREKLLTEEGGTWSVEEVAKHLHLTRQAVNRRRKLGTLIGLDAGRHGFRYPAWQFTRQGTIAGLEQVLHAMNHLDPWMQQIFMLGDSKRLDGRRGVDVLRQGDVKAVATAGFWFGQHGAD